MEETNTNGESQNNRWAWIVTGVVIVIVVAGFYVWPQQSPSPANVNEETPIAEEETPDATASALQQVSPSDEVSDIENDLNNTNTSDLDNGIQDIETEVNNVTQ